MGKKIFQCAWVVLLSFSMACKDDGPNPPPPPPVVTPPPVDAEKELSCKDSRRTVALPIPDRVLPEAPIQGPFQGNGHSQTWDGRLIVNTQNVSGGKGAWVAYVMRPSQIGRDSAGRPTFPDSVLSPAYVIERNGDPNIGMGLHNALAIAPLHDPKYTENPYRSNQRGDADPDGIYESYQMLIYTQNYDDGSKIGSRRALAVIRNPRKSNAEVESFRFLESFKILKTTEGLPIRGIEPTLTTDGRLMIYQGDVANDGNIDHLLYTYHSGDLNDREGWSVPREITSMNSVERNTVIDGVPFFDRYPLAANPLKNSYGENYAAGADYRGAYPWISHDGTELFHTTTPAGNPGNVARRGAEAVIGRWTGWQLRHIDGVINPNRYGRTSDPTVRLFFSSPGAFGTMWAPYPEVDNLPIPYTSGTPVYPLFGSNTRNYAEVSFEDAMDGDYVTFLHMNEAITRGNPEIDTDETPDTSGNRRNGKLEGAKFPYEYENRDAAKGKLGQAIYFPSDGQVRVSGMLANQDVRKRFTVEFFVWRLVDWSKAEGNGFRKLVSIPGMLTVFLEETGAISTSIFRDGQELRSAFVGNIGLNKWTHVAISFDSGTGFVRTYLDGVKLRDDQVGSGWLDEPSGDMTLGSSTDGALPESAVPVGKAIFLLDEFKLSRVVRNPIEIAVSTKNYSVSRSYGPIQARLPLGLRASELKVPSNNPITDAKVKLGRELFNEVALSRSRSMSCATCHAESKDFTDLLPVAIGRGGAPLKRNTQTIFNRGFTLAQFWDGRAATLEDQVVFPISNPKEMDFSMEEGVERIKAIPKYEDLFDAAYGQGVTSDGIIRAIATFERTVFKGGSPVDHYEAGELDALSPAQIRGRALFHGKARCVACHNGSTYSDEGFHVTGFNCEVSPNGEADAGRYDLTKRNFDIRAFKTPTLRGIVETAPFLHDGSVGTIEEMIELYNEGGKIKGRLDTEIRPLGLTADEKDDLVSFIEALSQ